MYEYVKGKAMWANITSPNTRFQPHKYGLTVLTDPDTASKLEGLGLTKLEIEQVRLSMTNRHLLLVNVLLTTMVSLTLHPN